MGLFDKFKGLPPTSPTTSTSPGFTVASPDSHMRQLLTRMYATMDEEIDSLIHRPPMHVGFTAEAGGMQAAEDQLVLLLSYRYFDEEWDWNKEVRALWPEGHERPGAAGWRVAVLHRGGTTFDAWTRDVTKIVAALRERFA